MTEVDYDDDYEAPLQHKKPFGAGLKRKRINFVPQTLESPATQSTSTAEARKPAHEAYLSIVFPNVTAHKYETSTIQTDQEAGQANDLEEVVKPTLVCPICKLPVPAASIPQADETPHEASIAHQICLEHSHPPSAIDRQRKGLAYLQSYGWDPDARKGLGATESGRLYPIRTTQKDDNRGIGASKIPVKEEESKKSSSSLTRKERKKARDKAKMKASKMRDLFYTRDEVNEYFGVEL